VGAGRAVGVQHAVFEMAEFALHISDIDESGKDYAFELKAPWLDAVLRDATSRADARFPPGAVHVHAQQNGNEYLVTGTLKAHLLTECGRCLGDAMVAVDSTFATLFMRHSSKPTKAAKPAKAKPKHAELELDDQDDDELQREPFTGNDIVLDELIREHLVLEVPMQPLCSESCQGIPVPAHVRPPEEAFSRPGDVDPRLAPLQRLRDNVPPKPDSNSPAKEGGTEQRPSKRSMDKE
jgi:uncharacterized protein